VSRPKPIGALARILVPALIERVTLMEEPEDVANAVASPLDARSGVIAGQMSCVGSASS
jgi:hypothetical protein